MNHKYKQTGCRRERADGLFVGVPGERAFWKVKGPNMTGGEKGIDKAKGSIVKWSLKKDRGKAPA